jgi:hypothetical protein
MPPMTEDKVRIAFEFREFEVISPVEPPPRRTALHRRVLADCWHALIAGLAMYAASYHGIPFDPEDLPRRDSHRDTHRARITGEDPWEY